MPDYRRAHVPGGTFFFTVVTEDRARFLCNRPARRMLRAAFRECRRRWPFTIESIVLLPDHLHAIWTLPRGDTDYSRRWAFIKKQFTKAWLASGGDEQNRSPSRRNDRRRGVWQRRFWEHTILDEADFIHHVEYIHFNPVRHGLANCPHDWACSSFPRAVRLGRYPMDWACTCEGQRAPVPGFERIMRTIGE
ncbi:MAG: transposase [Planctomycetes bacterium]|nr:transposase [Planctomycetota bacterium]